jgi:phage regulator Rha-like protein
MTSTRTLLDNITLIYLNRFTELEEIIRQDGLTKDVNTELKAIANHCITVEKLLIEEASKLASALPGYKTKLAVARTGERNE